MNLAWCDLPTSLPIFISTRLALGTAVAFASEGLMVVLKSQVTVVNSSSNACKHPRTVGRRCQFIQQNKYTVSLLPIWFIISLHKLIGKK